MQNDIVKIDNNFKDEFFIRYTEDVTTDTNEAGEFTRHTLLCYDKNGTECQLVWVFWKDFDVIACGISYANIQYAYQGVKVN